MIYVIYFKVRHATLSTLRKSVVIVFSSPGKHRNMFWCLSQLFYDQRIQVYHTQYPRMTAILTFMMAATERFHNIVLDYKQHATISCVLCISQRVMGGRVDRQGGQE